VPELAFDGSLSLTREMHSSASAWPAWLPLPVQWEGYALKEGNTVLMVALSALALLWGCWNLGVLLFGCVTLEDLSLPSSPLGCTVHPQLREGTVHVKRGAQPASVGFTSLMVAQA
jgi:hypothetical protein